MKYTKKLFQKDEDPNAPNQVEINDILLLQDGACFLVDDVGIEYKNDEVAELYDENGKEEDVKPEHSIYTFYDKDENEISHVPGTAQLTIFRRVNGIQNPS